MKFSQKEKFQSIVQYPFKIKISVKACRNIHSAVIINTHK